MADRKEKNLVDERWNRVAQSLRRAARDYWTNTAYVVGGQDQWIFWSETENGIRRLEPNPKRSRVTRNRLKRSVRVNLGKLLKGPLQFNVSPQDADDAAVRGAEIAQTTLQNTCLRQNWEKIRSSELLSSIIGGTSAVCIEWDPAGYRKVGTTDSGRGFGEGDVCLKPLSIIEFGVEPGATDGEMARWFVMQTAEDPEDVKIKFGLDKAPEPDAMTAVSAYEQRLLGASTSMSGASRSYEGRVMVRTMYERPSSAVPKGRVVSSVGGKIVQDVPWPFRRKDRLNLVIFRDFPMDGRWTGEAMLTDAVPVQTEINLARSIIMEHLKKAGNARLWVPDGGLEEDDLNDDPGQPVFYNPVGGAHAEWAAPPPLPQWEINYPEQAAVEIDDILGVHDISRGEAPKGVEAGVALSILAEADSSPLAVPVRDQAEGWGRIGTFVLECYEQFITMPRPITVQREGIPGGTAPRPYKVDFTGDMLHGQTTATVPVEVMAPQSRAVQEARANQLLQMGAFGSPPDMRLYVRVANLPNQMELLSALNQDADRAQRENEEMFRGKMAEVFDFDNHGIHIAEHNYARKSERYERLTGEGRTVFDLHIKAHEVMAAEEAARSEMRAAESPALAAAPHGTEPPGAAVPAAVADQSNLPAGPPPMPPGPTAEQIQSTLPPPPEPQQEQPGEEEAQAG